MNRYHYGLVFSMIVIIFMIAVIFKDYQVDAYEQEKTEIERSTAYAIDCATKDTKDNYLSAGYSYNVPNSFFKGYCMMSTRYSEPSDLYPYVTLVYLDEYAYFSGSAGVGRYEWTEHKYGETLRATTEEGDVMFPGKLSDFTKEDYLDFLSLIEKDINASFKDNSYSINYYTDDDMIVLSKQLYQNKEHAIMTFFTSMPTNIDGYFYTGFATNLGSFVDKRATVTP